MPMRRHAPLVPVIFNTIKTIDRSGQVIDEVLKVGLACGHPMPGGKYLHVAGLSRAMQRCTRCLVERDYL
jgi:hypothetical protein